MLTPKQEKFIQNIVKGMSQREAYKDAYNCKKMSDSAIDVNASKLFKNAKVRLRYKELIDGMAKSTIMTAQERLEYLTGIVKETVKEKVLSINKDGKVIEIERPADLNTKLKAMDQMNKMQGEYVTKIEGNVSVKLEDLL